MKFKDNLNLIKQYLPFSLRSAVGKFPSGLQEIRLRVNRPVALYTPDKTFFIDCNLNLTDSPSRNPLLLTQRELTEMFSTICSYSVYSKQNEIINGFVTLKGGNRAGLCGTCVVQNDKIINIRDITSINLRLCAERIGCADNVLSLISPLNGVMLCGAPCSGKTTILRDLARQLSCKYKTSLIDARSELAAVYAGIPQNDVGLCDVLNSYTKRDGFEHAVRCLSPELIICDEIGGAEDARSILNARKSGVSVIASAHCRDKTELLSKPYLYKLLDTRCFESVVFLSDGSSVGQVTEVVKTDELL
ncbi:MAG: stage III sporulation protein AA [Ruminococcus sp.]|nr:stage III sporulation protein AA [Ruminococcus sp.]